MEEGTELLERLGVKESHHKPGPLPLFTSCCPGWVRFAKTQYPELVPNISSTKSPQQMFGAVAKTYYAQLLGVPADKIAVISIMPCTAKKYEAGLSVMNQAAAGQDVDLVLTTRELCAMIKEEGVQAERLAEEEWDTPLGVSTGAAVIFGATGGVMEAALRSAYYLVTGKNPEPTAFSEVRGLDGWKEAKFVLPGKTLRVAVAHGLGNARKLIEAIKQGQAEYDFVEIMACRAAAQAAEVSQSLSMMKNWLESGPRFCTDLTIRPNSDSHMRTQQFRIYTRNSWANLVLKLPTSCFIQIRLVGK